MKLKLTTLIAAIALLATPSFINAQLPAGGPGIAVAGSFDPAQLPQSAQKFLRDYYPEQQCAFCQKEYGSGEYELRMTDGTEVTFASDGKVLELDAPRGQILPAKVVKALVPEKSYKHLNDTGYLGMVDEIEFTRRGVKVSLRTNAPDDITYDVTGEILEIDYD